MRLNTGADPVAGSATGCGVGCGSSPNPGLRSFGAVVVVVGGTVVVVDVVVDEVVVVDVVVVVLESTVGSTPNSCTAAAASGRAAPPLNSNGPAPKAITRPTVRPIAIAKRSQWCRCGRRRARRDAGTGGELTRGTVLAAVPFGGAR
jgi:hypothetical protein